MQKTLNLPRKYKAELKKFEKHNGKPKLSYSQFTSFIDSKYKNSYILGYIFKIEQESNFWAKFGNFCGTALEYRMQIQKAKEKDRVLLEEAFNYFNEKDITTLKKVDNMMPESTLYEREIVLDRGSYVIQGFIDVNYEEKKKQVVIDNKTGNKNSKDKGVDFYGSEEYGQTVLYSKALEEEGEDVGYVGVILMDRVYETKKTNPNTSSTFENPILHLSGEVIEIETSYSEERVKKLLKKVDDVALEISSLKTTYDKLSNIY